MATNILIGVGGTGAKVVEAVLHATAAGLGPDALTVGFVDQDQSNGNVSRSVQLLNTLAETRALWRAENARNALGAGSGLLRPDIRSLSPGHDVWVPHREQRTTLAMIFGEAAMEPQERHLFDLLFAGGEEEQHMPLDEGYRGRPNIGAAAMTARVDEDVEFWRALLQRVEQAQGGEDVRLVLAGSVFGGTGAAGFPTLARLIRKRLQERGVSRNVRLGGVLMLPYFGFERPKSDEGLEGNVARREQLLLQSQGALKYYGNLFRQEQVFDELYFVGWNRLFELGYHSAGASDQANPPLPPELLAALGVCGFYRKAFDGAGDNRVLVSSRADDRALSWSDLPSPDARAPDAPYEKLGQMLRFSTAWLYWQTMLVERGAFAKLIKNDPWYRVQGVDKVDFRNQPPEAEVRKLTEYVRSLLWWAACQEGYSESAQTQFNLWRMQPVIGSVDRNRKTDPYRIRETLDEAAYIPAFGQVVVKKAAADDLPPASLLLERLSTAASRPDSRGLGTMVASLHDYSQIGTA